MYFLQIWGEVWPLWPSPRKFSAYATECNPKFDYVFLEHVTTVISRQFFYFPTSILVTFTTESYLRSEVHIVTYTHVSHCTPEQLLFSFTNFICAGKRHRSFRSVFST